MSTKWLLGNKDDFTGFVMKRRTKIQANLYFSYLEIVHFEIISCWLSIAPEIPLEKSFFGSKYRAVCLINDIH